MQEQSKTSIKQSISELYKEIHHHIWLLSHQIDYRKTSKFRIHSSIPTQKESLRWNRTQLSFLQIRQYDLRSNFVRRVEIQKSKLHNKR